MTRINISYVTDCCDYKIYKLFPCALKQGLQQLLAIIRCRYSSRTNQTTQVSQRRYFGGQNFHIVEFAKTLAYNIKIQYKCMYGQTNCFRVLFSSYCRQGLFTELSQGRHFGGPNFHIVEFAKTLAHNVKIQSKFIYGFILYYCITDLVLFNC